MWNYSYISEPKAVLDPTSNIYRLTRNCAHNITRTKNDVNNVSNEKKDLNTIPINKSNKY